MKKLTLTCLCILFLQLSVSAQENPFRIGIKFGIPNIASLNLEYATPFLNNRLASTLDFSSFSIKIEENEISFSYIELGGNYYFLNKGKGPYTNLSLGRFGFKGNYEDALYGSGRIETGIGLINLKLGGKFGNIFYFRPEVGYGFILGGSELEVEYTDSSDNSIFIIKKEPPRFLSSLAVNFGFGLSF